MYDDEDVYPQLPNIFNEKLHWKEQEPVLGMSRLLLAKCYDVKCTFMVWGSWMSDDKSFQFKYLISDHKCSTNLIFGSIVTYRWIGTHFTQQFFNNQKMSVRLLREDVKTTFGIVVSMSQRRRAKKYALSLAEGTVAENYARIWSYGKEIKRSNLGSTVKIYVDTMPDGKNYFNKIYICFVAVKESWRGGVANNGIFSIAWAVVYVENKENWKWLIENLAEDLQCWNEGSGLVLVSNQHKGLVEAVKEVFPAAEHRQCDRHIHANFRKKFSGAKFENLFWRASKEKTEAHFNTVMIDIEKLNPKSVKHLMDRDPKTWSLAFFRVHNSSCESVENGFSESFNSVILDARKKPIISMLS
ncbi:uncharacterized protein LOC128126010 [Lactuca sativa]|uniref:uncharacterized protein LOC128126010 n=1 Tax=Lactuca sativa TaxID=4236 RepID=UPI0022AF70F6|nr:uncharacterized protein LOC128126010 [Lactuca sativa]